MVNGIIGTVCVVFLGNLLRLHCDNIILTREHVQAIAVVIQLMVLNK